MSLRLNCKVDQIQLDPEDELTQNVDPANVAYYVYLKQTLIKVLAPAREHGSNCQMILTHDILKDQQAQLSLVARDVTQWLKTGAPIPEDESAPQVGTISLNVEYFRNLTPAQHGETYTQWITLFDDQDDDEYDGDLGEDDEELPMLRAHFTVGEAEKPQVQESTPSPQKATPSYASQSLGVKEDVVPKAALKKPSATSQVA
jgi:hypothetical protein